MKIDLKNIEDVSEDMSQNFKTFEKFKSRKRKLTANKNVNNLISKANSGTVFNTSDLEDLRDRGLLDELICIIKSGKEASVYLGKNDDGHLAVKIYTDLRVRSFRKDDVYRQGRFVGDARIKKAIDQGSEFGLDAHQILWVNEEFRQMKSLYERGITLPRPIANSGLVVVMEFIGTDGEGAPRISDLDLTKEEAEEAFRQSIIILNQIVAAGKIHGDYSAYNLLWHNEKAVVIDFPQVINIESNPFAKEILRRDVNSICKSFKKYKIETNSERIYNDLSRII